MTYGYDCTKCHHEFDVIKSHRDMERNENCPKCGEFALRQFIPQRVFFSGAKVEHAEFNPGLGCVVRNKHHKQELMKQKGLVEVGNDFGSPDRMVDHFDKERADKRQKRWEDD